MQTKLTNIVTGQGLAAAIAAAALAVMIAWLTVAGGAFAQSGGSISVDPASQDVAPDGSASVDIVAVSPEDNLGAWDIDVSYDDSVLNFDGCTTDVSTSCEGSQGTVRIAGVALSLAGIEGTNVLGTLNFTAIGDVGDSSDISISVTEWADGPANPVTPSLNDGSITIAEPTEAPTDAPTDAPTATAGSLPDTGGDLGTGSDANTLAWVLAASGLMIVAGGAWAVARARREI
jgi:hypothetical protein